MNHLRLMLVLVLAALLVAVTGLPGKIQFVAQSSTTAAASISPDADAYVSTGAPHKFYGSSPRLTAGGPAQNRKVSYLRFDVASFAAGAVQKASLVLTRDAHHLSGTVSLYAVPSDSWDESSLAAASAPALGALIHSVRVTRTSNRVTFDVTRAISGRTTVSFAVTSSLTSHVVRFKSREATSGRPRLTVTAAQRVAARTSTPSTPAPRTSTPSTPAPRTSTPSTPPSSTSVVGTPAARGCTISAKLVPSCGRLWGIAPRAFTSTPVAAALALNEVNIGRQYDMLHTYHTNRQLFPTPVEKALALAPGKNRLLYLNWKPATDMSWRQVANGAADSRIDAEAAHLKASFPYPFFLTIWHEPENDVNPAAGSGETAADFAAMYRHVVLRLRADGVSKAVTVMNFMGYDPWAQTHWFSQLWPGNDVVDWIGIDPYATGDATGYLSGDFNSLVNRKATNFPGFYTWATTQHPGLPIIVAEWGVKESTSNPTGKAAFFNSVTQEIGNYPQVRALQYFDTPMPPQTFIGDTRPDSSSRSLAAYRRLANSPAVYGPRFHYVAGGIAMGG